MFSGKQNDVVFRASIRTLYGEMSVSFCLCLLSVPFNQVYLSTIAKTLQNVIFISNMHRWMLLTHCIFLP